MFLVSLISGCGHESSIELPSPTVSSVVPDSAGYKDTLTIYGSGFKRDRSLYRVVFSPFEGSGNGSELLGSIPGVSSREVTPISVSGDHLVCIVPDGVFTKSIAVENTALSGIFPMGVAPPPSISSPLGFDVLLHKGDVARIFFTSYGYRWNVKPLDSSDDYLVIIFCSSVPEQNTDVFDYSVEFANSTGNVLAVNGAERGLGASGGGEGPTADGKNGRRLTMGLLAMNGEKAFKRHVRREISELLEREGHRRQHHPHSIEAWRRFEGSAPQSASFNVLNTATGSVLDPSNFTVVQAELKYEGEHTLLYVDTNTPPSCLTDDDARFLGSAFDEHIYQTDHEYFGTESDINHDGKVAILMSPVINALTAPGTADTEGFIAGFFLANDLLPHYLDSRTTNGMEIFYTIVPDPTGQYGNVFPKDKTIDVVEGVLGHEFLHMILFNYRVLIYGRGYSGEYMEELWLNEGLAHIAEDLNNHNSDNIKRANMFLNDPGGVALIYGGDELEERGAAYLFLRYLGDRFGDTIFKKLVQSHYAGIANIEHNTGMHFFDAFADWSAACYLSGLGITSDPRFSYTSVDLRNDFDALHVEDIPSGSDSYSSTVKAMGPEFLLTHFNGGSTSSIDIESKGSNAGKMNAILIKLDD